MSTAIVIVIGLGIYQRLSAEVDQRVEAGDRSERN